ncbi:hypothetical protein BJ741DRAFT_580709 [Chytriomyces cf. hyalinus JEL632]|nr:hypothetical protein BJ741DRAFT_580709 [Chytriomyces cf. hyalinus JEL632]
MPGSECKGGGGLVYLLHNDCNLKLFSVTINKTHAKVDDLKEAIHMKHKALATVDAAKAKAGGHMSSLFAVERFEVLCYFSCLYAMLTFTNAKLLGEDGQTLRWKKMVFTELHFNGNSPVLERQCTAKFRA